MHGQREALVFHPQPRHLPKRKLQGSLPLLHQVAGLLCRTCFRAVIADDLSEADAAEFVEDVCAGASGDNDAGIERRQAVKQIARPNAHGRLIGMGDNGRQCSIEVEGAQGPFPRQPGWDGETSLGKKILHFQAAGPGFARSARRPATRS